MMWRLACWLTGHKVPPFPAPPGGTWWCWRCYRGVRG